VNFIHYSNSEDETERIAKELSSDLTEGGVVLLNGNLGSGKTVFVRGLVAGVGGNPQQVTSPTFTIIHEYTGNLSIKHIDLYRVHTNQVEDLGLEELISSNNLVVIEWADRLPRAFEDSITVYLKDAGENKREIQINNKTSNSV